MPKSLTTQAGLLDTWGRRNRKHVNKECSECGRIFHPRRDNSMYCSRVCAWKNNGGRNKKPETWWINKKGYVEGRVWLPDGTQLRIKQHRFIMEGILGRPLLNIEDVHHKDGNKANNSPDNLELVSHGEHSRTSNLLREYKKGYKMKLSAEERKNRSFRAIAKQLWKFGHAALAKAGGK